MHTVKWFQELLFNISCSVYQVFLSNMNNLHKAVWFQRTNNKIPSKGLNSSTWPTVGTLSGSITKSQSGCESNNN